MGEYGMEQALMRPFQAETIAPAPSGLRCAGGSRSNSINSSAPITANPRTMKLSI
jgi:hypothetical protein